MSDSIHFKMEGPVLENTIPLDIALIGLNNLQSILNKSYLAISENQRITKKARSEFTITFTEIHKGSIEADLNLIVAAAVAVQQTMPFVATLTAKSIWELTQQAFTYLKFVLESVSKGRSPTYGLIMSVGRSKWEEIQKDN